MITLGGVELNNNLYLDGVESAKLTATSQKRTLDGESVVRVVSTPAGRTLTLTTLEDGAVQGIWCKETIDSLKSLELQANVLQLNYRGDTYSVVVTETSFTPMFQFEIESPTKKYKGSITLLEV